MTEERAQLVDGVRMIGADDREGWVVVVANRRTLAQKLGLETQMKIDAVLLSRLALDDRPNDILDRPGRDRRAKDEHVHAALLLDDPTDIVRETLDRG